MPSWTITRGDKSFALTASRELNSGNQGQTYIGTLDATPVVIKKLPSELSKIAKERLIEQIQIESLLETKFGACSRTDNGFTCFKGLVCPAAFLKELKGPTVTFRGAGTGTEILLLYSVVPGRDLFDVIIENTQTLAQKVSIIQQLLTIVQAMHEKGIIHRDIKPENLMWDGSHLKIIDFGLACTKESWAGDMPGTPGFAAPELLRQDVGEDSLWATDIFAAGMTIIQLITGRSYLQLVSEVLKMQYENERAAMLRFIPRRHYFYTRSLDYISIFFGDMPIETCNLFYGMIHPTASTRPTAGAVLATIDDKEREVGAALNAALGAGGAGGAAAVAPAENGYTTPKKAGFALNLPPAKGISPEIKFAKQINISPREKYAIAISTAPAHEPIGVSPIAVLSAIKTRLRTPGANVGTPFIDRFETALSQIKVAGSPVGKLGSPVSNAVVRGPLFSPAAVNERGGTRRRNNHYKRKLTRCNKKNSRKSKKELRSFRR